MAFLQKAVVREVADVEDEDEELVLLVVEDRSTIRSSGKHMGKACT